MQKPFHHLARAVIIKNNRILLAKAIGTINTFLPGGHIEFGESAKDALERELAEELGIRPTVGKLLGLVEHKWEKQGILHCEINQFFEVESDELDSDDFPVSRESHITFFWSEAGKLEANNVQPYPIRGLLKGYLNGINDVWWESTLKTDIDVFNKN
ncbi:NUDIX domain-containing protein [Fictibacillus solisalsi]|uniref:NUDIX domain-containing protein n=1 Tax=Fictibacillus solisalsi TaxID=459525 RepID=A0A1G9YJ69_9BACL|nr:NUDIX domain-containing protein [Fictibacillus solisalsi]SDN08495.1 NUDIX domain-containing protein [Fictibacillus solisalsi]